MKAAMEKHVFAFSLIIEDTTEKVLQLVIPLKSIYNQILGFIVQKIKNLLVDIDLVMKIYFW